MKIIFETANDIVNVVNNFSMCLSQRELFGQIENSGFKIEEVGSNDPRSKFLVNKNGDSCYISSLSEEDIHKLMNEKHSKVLGIDVSDCYNGEEAIYRMLNKWRGIYSEETIMFFIADKA